MTMQHHSPRHS